MALENTSTQTPIMMTADDDDDVISGQHNWNQIDVTGITTSKRGHLIV